MVNQPIVGTASNPTHLRELIALVRLLWDDLQSPGQVGDIVDVAVGVHVAAPAQLAGRSQLHITPHHTQHSTSPSKAALIN